MSAAAAPTAADDRELLRRFAHGRDHGAFTELVTRHLGLVYSAALRQVGGDAHLAQDVAQQVFTDLARKAPALAGRDALAGWLHTSTHYAAANAVRTERRRRQREQKAHAMEILSHDDEATDHAWAQVRPVLDDALQTLRPADRDALLLRFFEGRNFSELAARFALTESGARMRVERALDRLRAKLERRGIRSASAALGALLTSHAIAAPPAGLAAAVTASALGAASAGGAAAGLLGAFFMTKAHVSIVATLVVAGGASIAWQQHELARLRESLEARRIEIAGLSRAQTNTNGASPASLEPAASTADLEILRAQKAALQQQLDQFTSSALERIRAAAPSPTRSPPSAAAMPPAVNGPVYEANDIDVLPAPVAAAQRPPRYPFEMKRLGIPGDALISFVVTEDGRVTDVAPEDATHPLFAMAAMDALAQWKFTPGAKDGHPVNVRIQQPISFRTADPNWFAP